MIWIWIVIGLIIVFLIFRSFIGFMGNWRMTLNRVITAYIANKQLSPHFNEKELFMTVLDGRYPYSEKGLGRKLYQAKEETKIEAEREIESGLSVLDKYDLTALIYTCLVIEDNSILDNNRYSSVEELLEVIYQVVNRQIPQN